MKTFDDFKNLYQLSKTLRFVRNLAYQVKAKNQMHKQDKFFGHKKSLLVYGQEATQMFSQRNNPYCELLSSGTKVK